VALREEAEHLKDKEGLDLEGFETYMVLAKCLFLLLAKVDNVSRHRRAEFHVD